jgi:hypothetical protein
MRRLVLPLVALAVLLLGFVGAGVAAADDLPPPVFPSGLPSPGGIGNDVGDAQTTPGPSYQITPGSAGTTLPAPDSARVQDARQALDRLNGKSAPKTTVAAPTAVNAVAPPVRGGTDWWLIGSGLLLVLVVSELGRINSAGAQHRRGAR